MEGLVGWYFRRAHGADCFPHLRRKLFAKENPRWLDAVSFDMYDPYLGNNVEFGLPRLVQVHTEPWEWEVHPETMGPWLRAYGLAAGDRPVHCVENGLCYRGEGGRALPRRDGVNRVDAFKATVLEGLKARNAGARFDGYFYWSYMDNYEWGNWEPRFGIFGLDFADNARRLGTDIAGNNMAGAYHDILAAWRSRDREQLLDAFLAKTHTTALEPT
jgi:beta-glucosidase